MQREENDGLNTYTRICCADARLISCGGQFKVTVTVFNFAFDVVLHDRGLQGIELVGVTKKFG